MSRPGQLAHGRSPGDVVRQFVDRFQEIDRRLRENAAMSTKAATAVIAAGISPTQLNQHQNGITFSTSSVNYPVGSIVAPAGYTRILFNMTSSAGATFSGSGTISVSSYIDIGGALASGDSISNGVPGSSACSVAAPYSDYYTVIPGQTVTFGAAALIVGSMAAGSGNVHVSAMVLFLR